MSFFRPETKITLNNENETLSLFDPFAVRVDFYSYATSIKGTALARTGFSDDVCRVSMPADSGIPNPSPEIPPTDSLSVPQAPASDPIADDPLPVEEPPAPDAASDSPPDTVSDAQDVGGPSQDSAT